MFEIILKEFTYVFTQVDSPGIFAQSLFIGYFRYNGYEPDESVMELFREILGTEREI